MEVYKRSVQEQITYSGKSTCISHKMQCDLGVRVIVNMVIDWLHWGHLKYKTRKPALEMHVRTVQVVERNNESLILSLVGIFCNFVMASLCTDIYISVDSKNLCFSFCRYVWSMKTQCGCYRWYVTVRYFSLFKAIIMRPQRSIIIY